MKILEMLVQVPPRQTKYTLELLCKCTAEILSTRLDATHPLALQAYADYYRHWNEQALGPKRRQELLKEYKQSLEKSETRFCRDEDRTVHILSSYAAAAYYLGRDNDLAKALATDLWERTQPQSWVPGTGDGQSGASPATWTIKAQCMADAASILGLVCPTYHENLRKTQREMRGLKKSMGCNPRTKGGRRKWRRISTAPEPPTSWEVSRVTAILRRTVNALEQGCGEAWDGLIATASLSSQLERLEKGQGTNANHPKSGQELDTTAGRRPLGRRGRSRIMMRRTPGSFLQAKRFPVSIS